MLLSCFSIGEIFLEDLWTDDCYNSYTSSYVSMFFGVVADYYKIGKSFFFLVAGLCGAFFALFGEDWRFESF